MSVHKTRITLLLCGLLACATDSGLALAAEPPHFVFRDVGRESGLLPDADVIKGHAAAWGDGDNDGWPDLYIGTYHQAGSKANLFFRNNAGKFSLDPQQALRISSYTSGAIFADFDNDGDLDLYVSNNAHGRAGAVAVMHGLLFRNDGGGKFTDVTATSGLDAPTFLGRSTALLDFDGDGLLDLLTCEEYYGQPTRKGAPLYRNTGGLRFEDVTAAAGLPVGMTTSGVAAADVNDDGWPDVFLTSSRGDNRLYLNNRKGGFTEAAATRGVFAWTCPSDSDYPAGVAFGDINRDGLLDIVVGQHFQRPWVDPLPIRVYLHRGIDAGGGVRFEEVTAKIGLQPLPMKAPHVEFQDFDNDGWPDLYASMVKFDAAGKPHPLIWRNLGNGDDGLPRFGETVLAINDFPTAQDRDPGSSRTFFDRVLEEKKVIYMAPGPTADFDRDGRLDLFLPSWWIQSPSLLLRNETPVGNWLQVAVEGGGKLNRMGIGTRLKVYPAGRIGDESALLARQDLSAGYGYCSGQEAMAHFGLGDADAVDLLIQFPHGGATRKHLDVKANQRITLNAP